MDTQTEYDVAVELERKTKDEAIRIMTMVKEGSLSPFAAKAATSVLWNVTSGLVSGELSTLLSYMPETIDNYIRNKP